MTIRIYLYIHYMYICRIKVKNIPGRSKFRVNVTWSKWFEFLGMSYTWRILGWCFGGGIPLKSNLLNCKYIFIRHIRTATSLSGPGGEKSSHDRLAPSSKIVLTLPVSCHGNYKYK